ncbi:MAG TPA: phosphotransacetylase family protein [Chloroflexota bacterium]
MATLYVMSMESFAGKTVFCLGLARKLAEDGFSVGYIRPLTEASKNIEGANACAAIMKRSLGLMESMDVLNPVLVDGETLDWVLADRAVDYSQKMMDAFKISSSGKDVMVVEGVSGLSEGYMVGLDARTTAGMLGSQCVLLVRPRDEMIADTILSAKSWLRDRMIGVIFNAVPRGMVEFVTESLTPYLGRRGIKTYAVIPEDRMLMAVTVQDLVDKIGGRVISGSEHMDTLVESVMVGAMSAENALSYFRRKPHKVVITGGDRPDIQLAALETSTGCLMLTGNLNPSPIIIGRAEELGVPVVIASQDTLTTAGLVEQAFTEVQFHEERKIKRYERLLENHLNYDDLKRDLGLGKSE